MRPVGARSACSRRSCCADSLVRGLGSQQPDLRRRFRPELPIAVRFSGLEPSCRMENEVQPIATEMPVDYDPAEDGAPSPEPTEVIEGPPPELTIEASTASLAARIAEVRHTDGSPPPFARLAFILGLPSQSSRNDRAPSAPSRQDFCPLLAPALPLPAPSPRSQRVHQPPPNDLRTSTLSTIHILTRLAPAAARRRTWTTVASTTLPRRPPNGHRPATGTTSGAAPLRPLRRTRA